jgi:Ca-activated chloride channel family protein
MLEWLWLWAFAILPLPILVWLLDRRKASSRPALRYPLFQQLVRVQSHAKAARRRGWFKFLIALTVWVLLVSALARPTWVGEPVPIPQAGRDLLLAVDISQSMREEDMQVRGNLVSRVEAVKAVVSEFVQRREGDRVGLILFAQQGYLQTPLTFDRDTVQTQLQEAQPGFAGNATAIGDAIGLAVKRLRDRPAESRVVILLTDGANTAGTDPTEGAKVAAEAGIRIHTIGVGAESISVNSFFGLSRQVNPSADLDEETLKAVAETTGGQYFRARDPEELNNIYRYLDQLEPVPEDVTFRPQKSLFHWPLGLAIGLSMFWALVSVIASKALALRALTS